MRKLGTLLCLVVTVWWECQASGCVLTNPGPIALTTVATAGNDNQRGLALSSDCQAGESGFFLREEGGGNCIQLQAMFNQNVRACSKLTDEGKDDYVPDGMELLSSHGPDDALDTFEDEAEGDKRIRQGHRRSRRTRGKRSVEDNSVGANYELHGVDLFGEQDSDTFNDAPEDLEDTTIENRRRRRGGRRSGRTRGKRSAEDNSVGGNYELHGVDGFGEQDSDKFNDAPEDLEDTTIENRRRRRGHRRSRRTRGKRSADDNSVGETVKLNDLELSGEVDFDEFNDAPEDLEDTRREDRRIRRGCRRCRKSRGKRSIEEKSGVTQDAVLEEHQSFGKDISQDRRRRRRRKGSRGQRTHRGKRSVEDNSVGGAVNLVEDDSNSMLGRTV